MTEKHDLLVLVVEDDDNDAELINETLLNSGFNIRVFRVVNGIKAMEFLYSKGDFRNRGEKNPDLILLDIKLPRVSGVEVLRKIRSDSRFDAMPVVVLTGSDDIFDTTECSGLGSNAYLVKNSGYGSLKGIISELILDYRRDASMQ